MTDYRKNPYTGRPDLVATKAEEIEGLAVVARTGNWADLVGEPVLPGVATEYQGALAETALQPTGNGSGLTGLTKAQVGLGDVDNTADIDKPVSTAMQTALDAKANRSVIDDRDYATLADADAAAVAAGKLLVISSQWSTVPATLGSAIKVLPGGSLDNSGALTINGVFEGCEGCFSGAGTITFGTGAIQESYPEWWGVDGTGTAYADVPIISAGATAKGMHLAQDYRVPFVYVARALRLSGPGRIFNDVVNKHILAFLEGTGAGVQIIGPRFGTMPSGSADDFAAIYFEDAKHPVVAFTEITGPNTGVRFGYTATDRATDGLLIGSHISGSKKMGVENINSFYGKVIANSMENAGVITGIHGIRVSGSSKGIIGALNSVRDKLNVASFQSGSRNAIMSGNYGENLTYGFREDSVAAMDSRHMMVGNLLRNITTDAYSLQWGSGYFISGMVDGCAGKGIQTATAGTTDGKHRIDLILRDCGSIAADIRNGKNLVTVLVDGSTAGTPVSIEGSDNLVMVLVTGTSITNTVYITGSNNVVVISESGTGVTGLRIDGNNNHVTGRVSGLTNVQGDGNLVDLVGAALTIGAGADSNKISGKFSGTITNSGTNNDLSGVFGLSGRGSVATNTTSGGLVTVNHGLSKLPATVTITNTGATPLHYSVTSKTTTQFVAKFWDITGAVINVGAVTFDWVAEY